ncbi:lipoprotein signal peptidase [Mycobacteroides abscessus subsp. abscessus]|nr:lipoprotein signal peptidase [Mycobacteroides abscessus subsp. abscessus]
MATLFLYLTGRFSVCNFCILADVLPLAIALILGGAIGNLIDRVSLGYVVDFIHVYYNNSHFPAFNIADSAITLGTILLLIDTFFLEKHRIERAQAQHD